MVKRQKTAALFLVLAWFLASAFLKIQPQPVTPSGVLLKVEGGVSENPFYGRICRMAPQSRLFETVKIQYLIANVRRSPLTFVRNGVSYDGVRAAKHFASKYRRRRDKVATAEAFIKECASYSSVTRKSYLVQLDEQTVYPLKDVLLNELHYLDEKVLPQCGRG